MTSIDRTEPKSIKVEAIISLQTPYCGVLSNCLRICFNTTLKKFDFYFRINMNKICKIIKNVAEAVIVVTFREIWRCMIGVGRREKSRFKDHINNLTSLRRSIRYLNILELFWSELYTKVSAR